MCKNLRKKPLETDIDPQLLLSYRGTLNTEATTPRRQFIHTNYDVSICMCAVVYEALCQILI